MRRLFSATVATTVFILLSLEALSSTLNGSVISYPRIRELIESNHLGSIEEVLHMLPESFRSNYVLMYSSGSTQPATFRKPRALLFSEDARFVMAFNDTPDFRGLRKFEIIQFRDETDSFEFYEIRFNPGAVPPEKAVYFSEKNPFLCSKCHRDDPRPNWDPFPITVGAYGSSEDRIFHGSDEDHGFRELIKTGKDGPYRFLIGLGKTEDQTETGYRLAGYPNTRFGTALNELNFRRMRRILQGTAGFERFRYALQAALSVNCCDEIEGFLPADLRRTFTKSFAEIRADTLKRRRRNAALLRRATAQFAGIAEEKISDPLPLLPADEGVVTAFRYIAQEAMGADMREWTMTVEVDSFLFTSSNCGLEHLGDLLLPQLLRDHPELGVLERKALCSRWKELSLNILGMPVTVGHGPLH